MNTTAVTFDKNDWRTGIAHPASKPTIRPYGGCSLRQIDYVSVTTKDAARLSDAGSNSVEMFMGPTTVPGHQVDERNKQRIQNALNGMLGEFAAPPYDGRTGLDHLGHLKEVKSMYYKS